MSKKKTGIETENNFEVEYTGGSYEEDRLDKAEENFVIKVELPKPKAGFSPEEIETRRQAHLAKSKRR